MRSIQDLMNLSGRVGLITGGAGHLGRVICETLAEQGAAIAVLDKAGSGLVASDLAKRYGVPTLAIDLDLADEVARKTVPERVVDALGGLDILVNNAAFVGTSDLTGWAAPFAEQTVETWRKAMEVNLTAVFDLSQAALSHLINRKHGSIMNIATLCTRA